ncbi:MAG: phenylacetate--CoA ligase family protein, partial [Christensenellales bacterium]
MFWQRELETMPRKELQALQLERLKWTLRHAYENVRHYRDKFDAHGVDPYKFRTLSDIRYFPYTTKEDLRDNYPYELCAVPMGEIVRTHASSGTTGKPIVGLYTKDDLSNWADQVARLCAAAGVTREDIVQISFGYGLFTGALGLHYGLERIGCNVIPVSSGNTGRQLMMLKDFGATVLVATPSYALYMSEVAREQGIVEDLKLRIGLFGAEGCTVEMRERIRENFRIFPTDNYGLTELNGPGISGECECQCGLHFAEDHFLPEIIDPDTLEVQDKSRYGELVLTSLTKQGVPMIRYRTRDITCIDDSVCACGRTHARMQKVRGRSDDMFIIKGVNVFPSQIESVLVTIGGIGAHYKLILRRKHFIDSLE